ncbi:UNVERIFIED_CONTAM: hypothetical protein NCL1_37848 [Trichonephila clavipes]
MKHYEQMQVIGRGARGGGEHTHLLLSYNHNISCHLIQWRNAGLFLRYPTTFGTNNDSIFKYSMLYYYSIIV